MTMLQELMGHKVVVDMRSAFVCIGTLKAFDDVWLDLRNADLHDLRDTQTSREVYVAESRFTGVKRNRKRVSPAALASDISFVLTQWLV